MIFLYFADFEMVETLLDENEMTLLSDIGITIRRKISGDEDDYTKVGVHGR